RRNKKLYGELLNQAYKKTTSLVAEQARLHSELEIAARIQTGLLRHDFSEIESKLGIGIAAFMEPAKEVGGDFYDVFLISGKRACVVMADVSGKGVPAAMFMAMAKTHIKNYGMLDMPLHELMYRVNNHLCEDNPEEMFVTAFVGILDMEQEVMTFINAGHNRPYLAYENGVFTQLACSSDLVFGLWEEQKYREQTVEFKKGARFFLYTDGVTEAENELEEMFGDDRL
ncbi:MAG: PP2C family protein-serine/threonine phosphatase, partial [Eubacteriales bacterium]|nr:PP2C family protein-serine/threonine phosphatase [Eubacteriales bacterium]